MPLGEGAKWEPADRVWRHSPGRDAGGAGCPVISASMAWRKADREKVTLPWVADALAEAERRLNAFSGRLKSTMTDCANATADRHSRAEFSVIRISGVCH